MMKIRLAWIILIIAGVGNQPYAQSIAGKTLLTIQIEPMVGEKNWIAGETYTNALGESFSIDKCLFYLSNLEWQSTSGKWNSIPNSYYLVNIADSSSLQIQLPLQNQSIKRIRFIIGVDSAKNVSGIQQGVLDPARGMFWTWNTGYVMAKLEGVSDVSTMPGKKFTYHIGGYAGEQNVTKRVELVIDNNAINQQKLFIQADLLKWFNGEIPVSIATNPICHVPGKLAKQIANNYQLQFRIKQPK
ncbi:MAG: hypothetical protein FGM61_06655 [Sediminibacterium sp.]|nr:hypothetical protein [Sediminibacterium sp.]